MSQALRESPEKRGGGVAIGEDGGGGVRAWHTVCTPHRLHAPMLMPCAKRQQRARTRQRFRHVPSLALVPPARYLISLPKRRRWCPRSPSQEDSHPQRMRCCKSGELSWWHPPPTTGANSLKREREKDVHIPGPCRTNPVRPLSPLDLPMQGLTLVACKRRPGWKTTRGRLQPVLMRHPPPAICDRTLGGGGVAGGWGGWGPKVGGLRAAHYYHMHTSRGDVCLGLWGYGGMYMIIALS